jgi:3-dehydroquinate synthase
LKKLSAGLQAMVVTDRNVAVHYLEPVADSLMKSGFRVSSHVISPGEKSKSFAEANRIYDKLIREHFDSQSTIIALGGGVVGDLAGFVAATFHRGIGYCQVPTTLLAQTDASIGGKVAINHKLGKNLIGSFHQPLFVLIDVTTLGTLPVRHWKNGMAEVIKYSIIRDIEFFEYLEKQSGQEKLFSEKIISEIIYKCCKIKSEIVSIDERDESIRMHLNFGHTIGHAIEACAGMGRILHGEAVGCGMIAASYISWKKKLLPKTDFFRVRDLIRKHGLAKIMPSINKNNFLEFLFRDKKRKANDLRFILIPQLGSSCSVSGIPSALILDSLDAIGKQWS